MRALAAAILAVTVSACGLTMTTGPDPDRPRDQPPRCTETYDAPKRDAIGAVLGGVAAIFGGIAFEVDNDTLGAPLVIGGLTVMLASYVSGGIGYFRVKRCKKAMNDYGRVHRDRSRPPLDQSPGSSNARW